MTQTGSTYPHCGITVLRAVILLAAVALGGWLPARFLVTATAAAGNRLAMPGPATVDDVTVLVASVTGLVVGFWLLLALAGSVLALMLDALGLAGSAAGRTAATIAPAALRRGVAVLLGLSLAGIGGPALAAPAGPPTGAGRPVATARCLPEPQPTTLDPGWTPVAASPAGTADLQNLGWTPTRPPAAGCVAGSATATGLPGPPLRKDQTLDAEVVVRAGDTLWDIAARHLGPGAGAAEIASAWPRWYAVNRRVIGDDPDRLEPGQRLLPPSRATV